MMKVDVEDALMMLAPCEGCGRTDCLWCRKVWQASIDGYMEDGASIGCGKMKEIFMRTAKEKEALYEADSKQEIQEGGLYDRRPVH